MAINKVVYGNQALIDLTNDTVSAEKLKVGATAHGANGQIISGELGGVYYGVSEPTDLDTKIWINPAGMNTVHEIPSGGNQGQLLIKQSNVDYDVNWLDLMTITTQEIDKIVG